MRLIYTNQNEPGIIKIVLERKLPSPREKLGIFDWWEGLGAGE
jgi:hypothetical protein